MGYSGAGEARSLGETARRLAGVVGVNSAGSAGVWKKWR